MNETVTAFLKVSHNLVRTGMYSSLFVRLGIMSRGPDRTFQGAVSVPRAVVCPSLSYTICIGFILEGTRSRLTRLGGVALSCFRQMLK